MWCLSLAPPLQPPAPPPLPPLLPWWWCVVAWWWWWWRCSGCGRRCGGRWVQACQGGWRGSRGGGVAWCRLAGPLGSCSCWCLCFCCLGWSCHRHHQSYVSVYHHVQGVAFSCHGLCCRCCSSAPASPSEWSPWVQCMGVGLKLLPFTSVALFCSLTVIIVSRSGSRAAGSLIHVQNRLIFVLSWEF